MKSRTLTYERRTSIRRLVLLIGPSLALLMYMVTSTRPVYATFPGTNGQITYGQFNPDIEDFQIFVANPDGSHEFQLTTVPSEVSDWSPDGTRIAYDFFDGQTVQIATINPDGTKPVQLPIKRTSSMANLRGRRMAQCWRLTPMPGTIRLEKAFT